MDARRKRLLFRAQHCGMRENDILLGGFAEQRIADLDERQLDAFEVLLGLPDNDVYDWISGRRPPTEAVDAALVEMIKNFNNKI